MRAKVIVCSALVAIVAVVPVTANARTQRAQTTQSVGDAVANELVRAGVNAAVAKWAPGLEQYVNPFSAGLGGIQSQLAEITNKLNQLIDHQYALEARLNCAIQRTGLNPVLGDAKAWFNTLQDQQNVPSLTARKDNFALLFTERERMRSDQEHLHLALIGANGAIRACAEHVQIGLRPFFSSDIGNEVNDFYATYHVAAAELLIVRVNLMALYPKHFPTDAVQAAAKQLETWWAEERSFIKPTFPSWLSYDIDARVLYHFASIPWQETQTGYIDRLRQEGWWVTGTSDIPTCSAIEATFKKSGFTGSAAVSWMSRHKIIWLNGPSTIVCYDDHGRLHEFSLDTYTYRYAGDFQSHALAIAARPIEHDGKTFIDVAHYAYTSLRP